MANAQIGVSDRIRFLISLKDMTIKEFSDFLGFPKSTLEKYMNGPRPPSAEFISLLHSKMGVSAHWLLDGIEPMYFQDYSLLETNGAVPIGVQHRINPDELLNGSISPDIVTLPKIDVRASAGPGQPVYSEDEVGRYAVKRSWLDRRGLKPENLSVISVVGDSMVPDLYEEDRIIIDHSQTDMKDTHIYAVRFSGDVFVKRIQRLPDNRALLISKNSDYPPVPVDTDADFQVIGRVVSSMHEW